MSRGGKGSVEFNSMQESDEDRARIVTGVCGYVRKRENVFPIERKKGGERRTVGLKKV